MTLCKSFKKYKTMQYQAAYIDALNSNCSEELRVLYVALTRAKEKLFIVGSIKSNSTVQSKLNSLFVNAYFKKMNSDQINTNPSFGVNNYSSNNYIQENMKRSYSGQKNYKPINNLYNLIFLLMK